LEEGGGGEGSVTGGKDLRGNRSNFCWLKENGGTREYEEEGVKQRFQGQKLVGKEGETGRGLKEKKGREATG